MSPHTTLITASTGIGAETARLLAAQGHRLFLVSRNPDHCEALSAELRNAGAEVETFAGDLTDPATTSGALARCRQCFGRIDGLYNVAGISGQGVGDGPLHSCTEEGWHKIIDTNLTTQYRMCREAIRVMLDQEPRPETGQRGVILNMASVFALHPEPKHFSAIGYAAAKGGIIAMTRAAAGFYAEARIRLNVIAPALTRTSPGDSTSGDPEVLDFIRHKQPLTGGLIPAPSVASVSAFLLSDASSAITGDVIEVTGGWPPV